MTANTGRGGGRIGSTRNNIRHEAGTSNSWSGDEQDEVMEFNNEGLDEDYMSMSEG